MATIRKYRGKFNVQIRKKGYPFISKSFISLTVAKKWAATTEADMERRLHVVIPDDTTVGELLKRYIKEVLPSHKGHQAERYRVQTLLGFFGGLKLFHLTPKEVAKYRDIRLNQVSPASLKRELTVFSQTLTTASKDWGIALPQNPVKMISLPKADKARTRRLEVGEEEKLLQTSNQKLRRIIVLALETAIRRGEILNVKRSHIDFQKSVLLIPSTKTDTPRTIPLSTKAVTVLRAQLRASQSGYEGVIPLHEPDVFDYQPRGLSGEFLKLCRRKGIENLHFHDLRHEATSRLFEKGLNPVEVATITGHKDTRMLMRYTHLRAEDLVKRLG
jgi:integrase